MGYTFWYIDGGGIVDHLTVLKVTLDGDFEDSLGKRYTRQSVSDLIKPLDKKNARKNFEKARDKRILLSYYPSLDVLG